MKKSIFCILIITMLFSTLGVGFVNADADGFVITNGNYFVLDGNPFYFAGTNNYYMHYSSDVMIDDVLNDAASMNLKVLRCWGFLDGDCQVGEVMQPSMGVYDESGFERMDYTINKAGELGIKLVIPFVNNWDDFGGMNQYVTWTGAGSHDDFYTNENCRSAYKNYINYMLNRENTYNGIKYKDDPAIMTWELANEPRCTSDTTGDTLVEWADEMSTYIKTIDSNHLVAVGDEGFLNRGGSDYCYNGGTGVDWDRLITLENIDYGTMHLYPDHWGKTIEWCTQYINDHIDASITVGKPVVLEEYGVQSDKDSVYGTWGDAIYSSSTVGEGASGMMFWLLTGIMDDGSLYADYDGFRVTYPSTTASVIIEYASLMNEKSGETPVNNSTISPITATFDQNIENQADISISITANGNTLNEIKNDLTTLESGVDYTIEGDVVTISKDYLASLSIGTTYITFDFSEGVDPILSVSIIDSTVQSGEISVQFACSNTSETSNSIYPNFQLTNTGSGDVSLINVKLRYYYTIDDEKSQNFWCDWSQVGSANVTGTFVEMDEPTDDADYYFEVGFTSDAGILAAGESIDVQTRFAKYDWSNYIQTNDYSFNSAATGYTDWDKVTGYLSGVLLWGIEP